MIVPPQIKVFTGAILSLFSSANAGCVFASDKRDLRSIPPHRVRSLSSARAGDGGVPTGGYDAVKKDIVDILTVSQAFFPADFADTVGANYGPLMIRLAWHCSGSYRATDGRGGCDGGRIRHDPEINWPDNANLDKALKILEPVKESYGSDLSWGDLIILAGNAAIESMGGPVLGFCGGRIDDIDGSNSLVLGPSDEQEELTPCVTDGNQGNCQGNLGPTTVGLIYVNPAGHLGNPDPAGLILDDIRYSFGKMGMNDRETLALAGGGHAFGKCHGACNDPPCGEGEMTGKGINTVTSGFEGAWTTAPTTWTNQYFKNLFAYEWKNITGLGGHPQWAPSAKDGSGTSAPDTMMLTSDIALINDPEFLKISQEFADDITKLEEQFQYAWYKLTTSDMGPATRCIGDQVPPAQVFQSPIPSLDGDAVLPDFIAIRTQIQDLIEGDWAKRGAFIDIAYKCGSTFRDTDYQGGCNGAFIRSDESEETQSTIKTLSGIKNEFSDASLADLIVLAGQVALEDAGSNAMAFCGGRMDASDILGRNHLKPVVYDSRLSSVVKMKDAMHIQGLTLRQGVALVARPTGTGELDNTIFVELMEEYDGKEEVSDFIDTERAYAFGVWGEDWALVDDDELRAISKLYAEDEDEFLSEFASAWTYLMTADRFDGSRGNVCSNTITPTIIAETIAETTSGSTAKAIEASISFAVVATIWGFY